MPVKTSTLAALREARSLFWALNALTARGATRRSGARSHLFELHRMTRRGLQVVDAALDGMESLATALPDERAVVRASARCNRG